MKRFALLPCNRLKLVVPILMIILIILVLFQSVLVAVARNDVELGAFSGHLMTEVPTSWDFVGQPFITSLKVLHGQNNKLLYLFHVELWSEDGLTEAIFQAYSNLTALKASADIIGTWLYLVPQDYIVMGDFIAINGPKNDMIALVMILQSKTTPRNYQVVLGTRFLEDSPNAWQFKSFPLTSTKKSILGAVKVNINEANETIVVATCETSFNEKDAPCTPRFLYFEKNDSSWQLTHDFSVNDILISEDAFKESFLGRMTPNILTLIYKADNGTHVDINAVLHDKSSSQTRQVKLFSYFGIENENIAISSREKSINDTIHVIHGIKERTNVTLSSLKLLNNKVGDVSVSNITIRLPTNHVLDFGRSPAWWHPSGEKFYLTAHVKNRPLDLKILTGTLPDQLASSELTLSTLTTINDGTFLGRSTNILLALSGSNEESKSNLTWAWFYIVHDGENVPWPYLRMQLWNETNAELEEHVQSVSFRMQVPRDDSRAIEDGQTKNVILISIVVLVLLVLIVLLYLQIRTTKLTKNEQNSLILTLKVLDRRITKEMTKIQKNISRMRLQVEKNQATEKELYAFKEYVEASRKRINNFQILIDQLLRTIDKEKHNEIRESVRHCRDVFENVLIQLQEIESLLLPMNNSSPTRSEAEAPLTALLPFPITLLIAGLNWVRQIPSWVKKTSKGAMLVLGIVLGFVLPNYHPVLILLLLPFVWEAFQTLRDVMSDNEKLSDAEASFLGDLISLGRMVTFVVFSLIIFFLGQAVLYWMNLLARPVETYPTYFIAKSLEFSIIGVLLMVFLEPSIVMVILGFVLGYYVNEYVIQHLSAIIKMKLHLGEHLKELLMDRSFFLAAMLIALDVLTFQAIFLIILITLTLQLTYKKLNLKQLVKVDDLLADYLGNAVVKGRTMTPLTVRMSLFVYLLFFYQFFISIVEAVVTFDLGITIINTIVQLLLVLAFLQRINFFSQLTAHVKNASDKKSMITPANMSSQAREFSITVEVLKTILLLTPFLSFPVYYFSSIMVLELPPSQSYTIEFAHEYLALLITQPFSINNFFSIVLILILMTFLLLFPFIYLSKDLESRIESRHTISSENMAFESGTRLPRGFFTGIIVVSGRYFAWEIAGMFLVSLVTILVMTLIVASPLDVPVTFKANLEMFILMILGMLTVLGLLLAIQRKAHVNLLSLFLDYPHHVKHIVVLLIKARRLQSLDSIRKFYRFSTVFTISLLLLLTLVSPLIHSSPLGISLDVTLDPRDGGISHSFTLERGRYILTVEVTLPNSNTILKPPNAFLSLYFVDVTKGNGKNQPILAISPGSVTKTKTSFDFELKSRVDETVALIIENLLDQAIHVKLNLIYEAYPDIWPGGPHYLAFVILFISWVFGLFVEWMVQSRLLLRLCLRYYLKGSHEAVLKSLPQDVIYP